MSESNSVYKEFYELISKYNFFKKRDFFNGEIITTYIKNRNRIFFILDGTVELIKNNDNVIGIYNKNNLFGEEYVHVSHNAELSLRARKDGELLYFSYNDILNSNISNERKLKILDILYKMLALENKRINERLELLLDKTTRDKLLSYFTLCKRKKQSDRFKLDLSITELADYLGVDRSAMTREIKNLIDDGIIKKEDRLITLIS